MCNCWWPGPTGEASWIESPACSFFLFCTPYCVSWTSWNVSGWGCASRERERGEREHAAGIEAFATPVGHSPPPTHLPAFSIVSWCSPTAALSSIQSGCLKLFVVRRALSFPTSWSCSALPLAWNAAPCTQSPLCPAEGPPRAGSPGMQGVHSTASAWTFGRWKVFESPKSGVMGPDVNLNFFVKSESLW